MIEREIIKFGYEYATKLYDRQACIIHSSVSVKLDTAVTTGDFDSVYTLRINGGTDWRDICFVSFYSYFFSSE